MGIVESYKELKVYRKSFDASILIHKMSHNFLKEEQFGLTSQIRRSSKSVCANIAEGFVKQRRSKAEFKRYLLMALASCNETQVWIEYCQELQYINKDQAKLWEETYEEIRRMLNALYSRS